MHRLTAPHRPLFPLPLHRRPTSHAQHDIPNPAPRAPPYTEARPAAIATRRAGTESAAHGVAPTHAPQSDGPPWPIGSLPRVGSPQPMTLAESEVDLRSTWVLAEVGQGSVWSRSGGQLGVGVGPMWVDLGSTWGRSAADAEPHHVATSDRESFHVAGPDIGANWRPVALPNNVSTSGTMFDPGKGGTMGPNRGIDPPGFRGHAD